MSGSHKPRQDWRHRVCAPHPCNTVRPVIFRLRGAPQSPYRAFEAQFAGLGFGHHAVEVAAGRGQEMLRLFGRDDRQRHRRQFAAHGQASVAPQRFRYPEIVPQPVGGIDDVRPGWGGPL